MYHLVIGIQGRVRNIEARFVIRKIASKSCPVVAD